MPIGVGKAHWFEPPLPPNRTGGSPAYGSPVGGFTSKRIDETSRGHGQVQQPRLGGQGSDPWAAPRKEGRQQPRRSLQRFEPRHVCVALSGALSPYGYGQSHRGFFRRLELHVSTFLHPFAPPELPGFCATMGALTPGRPALRLTREHRLDRRPGLPASCHRAFRSFRLQPPAVVPTRFWGFWRRAYRTTGTWSPVFRPVRQLGFAIEEQARHDSRPNRVHWRYGLIVHLRLLSTPPRGDAVTFGYGVPEHPGRDLHPADSMHLQAHSSPLRGVFDSPAPVQ